MALSQAVYQVRNPVCKKGKEYITLFTLLRFCYLTRSHHSVAIFLILTHKFIFQLLVLLSVQISMLYFTYASKSVPFTSPFNFLLLTCNSSVSKLNGRLILLHFLLLTQNVILLSLSHFKWVLKLDFFLSFPPHSSFFLVPVLTSTAQKLTLEWVLSSKTCPLTSLKPNKCSVSANWVQCGDGRKRQVPSDQVGIATSCSGEAVSSNRQLEGLSVAMWLGLAGISFLEAQSPVLWLCD